MAASPSPPWAFIHVPKTGGETVLLLLGADKTHASAEEACGRDPQAWQRAWTFAVVRNPWDRMVSWYHHLRRHAKPVDEPRLLRMQPAEQGRWAERMPFRRWARAVLNGIVPLSTAYPVWGPSRRQLDMLTVGPPGHSCRPAVGTVYRFERLPDALADILTRLGRASDIVRIDVTNRHDRDRPHYSTFYGGDQELIDLVAQRFADDARVFGYRFERGPQDSQVHADVIAYEEAASANA